MEVLPTVSARESLFLGDVTGPLLIFGGPYSNLPALLAMKEKAEQLGIPPEQCICTGDIVAYCAQPQETVAAIRDWGVHCLMGNCEASFANDADDCGCGFEEGSHCDVLSAQWFQFANQALSKEERQWFGILPEHIRFTMNGQSALVVHGSVSSMNQFIFSASDEAIFERECAIADADLIIGGHCGIPFTRKVYQPHSSLTVRESAIWHNAGVIGMPANDGTTRTWFSVIEAGNTASSPLLMNTYPLYYHHQDAFDAMCRAGLQNAYADALLSGLWPSMDVLPDAEKQRRGIAIHP